MNAVDSPRRLLEAIAGGWSARAQVKTSNLEGELVFDPSYDDFLESLLPFAGHPTWERVSPALRSRVLTSGWAIYNQKTVTIEVDVVTPACNALLKGAVSTIGDPTDRVLISETLIDEAYHVLLAVAVSDQACGLRDVHIQLPEFALLQRLLERETKLQDARNRMLLRLAVATVSELFISDYLAQLSTAETIQPVHRLAVASHRKDELAHARIFGVFAPRIVHALSSTEKDLFAAFVADAVAWFADSEAGVWAAVLESLQVPGREALLAECALRPLRLAGRGFKPVLEMAAETGLERVDLLLERLHRHGLSDSLQA